MSGTLEPLPHALSCSRRYYKDGYAVARLVHLRMPQLARPFGSSHAVLVLATNLIHLLHTRDRHTTGSQLVTATVCARTKSP
jgi:hypothetical protein